MEKKNFFIWKFLREEEEKISVIYAKIHIVKNYALCFPRLGANSELGGPLCAVRGQGPTISYFPFIGERGLVTVT